MFFSDNFISGARFDMDIYEGEYMKNIRQKLNSVTIVDREYPEYKNSYEGYEHVYDKYHERMPQLFRNDDIETFYVPTKMELLQYWNYTILHFDSLYDYFDNYESRFVDCCPVGLKCEVVSTVKDEYYVLDRFSDLFQYENKDLMKKTLFYCLRKYI
jgi:hypothetical protein